MGDGVGHTVLMARLSAAINQRENQCGLQLF